MWTGIDKEYLEDIDINMDKKIQLFSDTIWPLQTRFEKHLSPSFWLSYYS